MQEEGIVEEDLEVDQYLRRQIVRSRSHASYQNIDVLAHVLLRMCLDDLLERRPGIQLLASRHVVERMLDALERAGTVGAGGVKRVDVEIEVEVEVEVEVELLCLQWSCLHW